MFSRFKADRSGGSGGIGSYGSGSNGAGGGAGGSSLSQSLLEGNAITTFFEIGRQTATAGPGYLWKVHDAYRKSDGKEASVFLFDKRTADKLHKPRRKETISEMLRHGVRQLERCRHPRLLHVLHSVEETSDTLAFATEPVSTSLGNVLAAIEDGAEIQQPSGSSNTIAVAETYNGSRRNSARDIRPNDVQSFLDIEIKYGIYQLIEALSFLHMTAHLLHRNVCPGSVLVTRRGTWKLAGLEFAERMNEQDGSESLTVQRWTSRIAKMAQPDLDFIAPEVQTHSTVSAASDMFSLGLVIAAIFNRGRPLIQANHSNPNYTKQMEMLNDQLRNVLPSLPVGLQEALIRLLSRDARKRPNAQLLSSIKFFSDPAVHALQFLDVINMKDPGQKSQFYRTTLKDILPSIPKKLWFQHVWPSLQQELRTQEVLAAALQPILLMIQEISPEEYQLHIMPTIRQILGVPKSIQASVTLLENLHIIVEKTPVEDLQAEIFPMLFSSYESTTLQVQSAALVAVTNIAASLDDQMIRKMVLPKTKTVFERNSGDLKLTLNVLACLAQVIDRLDKSAIIDEVLPLLWDVKLQDPEIIQEVVSIYQRMISNKKNGLSVSLMATRVMPSLLPQTMNPSLSLEQFSNLLEVLQEMLDHIDRHQRNKLKLDNLSLGTSPERMRPLRHQHSTDNMHAVNNFNIPFVKVEQRKTCSEENMIKTHSSNSGPGSPDSNYLRVAQSLAGRRLSDNSNSGNRGRPAPSSSIHLSPATCLSVGSLPTRRHSSIGSTDRRPSTANLLPPTISLYSLAKSSGGPNGSTSVPMLSTGSISSFSGLSGLTSRRPSMCPPTFITGNRTTESGSSILQQIGSGVYQLFSGK
ncbi:hypothetical protein GHT06_005057 [Daphnia sinensis]|uniref:Protein kinase domain-containing protein n=1 Tax=Daphnia sinensis TaxID=1820382 RepID=A0AAD5KUC8_9CRUS|nr:hypothetical protein GHT06_005057 [Daphnia sinensis]